jgi:hypothetical protein
MALGKDYPVQMTVLQLNKSYINFGYSILRHAVLFIMEGHKLCGALANMDRRRYPQLV